MQDIEQYCEQYSDFAFELSVAHKVKFCGIDVFDQSGIYIDPNTNLPREFDIRARKTSETNNPMALKGQVIFPIECKNIREYSPLVVHCIRRDKNKAYQNAIYNPSDHNPAFLPNQQIVLWERDGFYATSSLPWVGLSIDQITKDQSGRIRGSDSNVYNKIAQATQSGQELIRDVSILNTTDEIIYLIHPVLVIPDKRLFVINYENDESMQPERASFISYYSGYKVRVQYDTSEMNFVYSHIDIVEISKLEWYFNQILHVLGLLTTKSSEIRNAYECKSHTLR